LRPLAALDGMVAHAAGFRGPPAHQPVYLAMLSRVLVARCVRLDPTADLQIDLTRMPDDPAAVISVVTAVHRGLREAGRAPAFRITPAMRAQARDQLAQVVIL
jgi:hypothetical protein